MFDLMYTSVVHRYGKSIHLFNANSTQRTVFYYGSYAEQQYEINDKLL